MTFRSLPALTPDNRDFWTGGETGELRIARCRNCGRFEHPPFPVCPNCKHRDIEHAPVSGRGRVNSFTINHHSWLPGMEVPFVFAAIELDEQPGLLVMSNIVNCPPEAVRIGLPVKVLFEQHQDVWVPLFELTP